MNRSDSNAEKKSENTNFNITNILKNISMEYKQQKFEGAFKPHKCQMANTKKAKKEITTRTQINNSSRYTGDLTCLNCNRNNLFLIKVIKN